MIRYGALLAGSDIESLYVQAACLVDPAIGEAGDVDSARYHLNSKTARSA